MKLILQIILFCLALPCFAQPTGHQKIFLEITDGGDTLDFKSCFKKDEIGRKTFLEYKNYQLIDIGDNQTGFQLYPRREFIHKTLMTDDHQIVIVKNKIDTMRIEILNAFNVYFMSIPFQKGKFRLYVADENKEEWLENTLPYKQVTNEQIVYNITPLNWNTLQIKTNKPDHEYWISMQYEKKYLFSKPIIPEDDLNFRNLGRINNLRKEVADYNFDGQQDYREHKMNDTTKWNYFIYKHSNSGFVLDTLLSSLDLCYFDFENKKFIGSKTRQIDSLSTQINVYEYIDSVVTLVQQRLCVKAFPNSEKTDCFIRVFENGKWVDKQPILGAE
jgi:hypothetical protein